MSSIILQAHSLTKKYRHTVALDHIDLQIEKGKIYGFIGQNGAGKTTFLRLVTGLAFLTSGTLDLFVLFLFITERGFSCLKHGTARRMKPLKEGRIRLTILLKFWASEELPHISL